MVTWTHIAHREPGEFIAFGKFINEQTPSDACYILLSGEVGVYVGQDRIAVSGPGQVTGESALRAGKLRSATVTTNGAAVSRPTAAIQPTLVSRKNVSFAQQVAIDRHYDAYVFGGNWDPVNRMTGTDCSGCVIDMLDAVINGTGMQWSRTADGGGGSTEDWRPIDMGGSADPNNGPFGMVMVDDPSQFPTDAAVLVALHHGPDGGANSHMWCQVDQLAVETHGQDSQFPNGATVLNSRNSEDFNDIVLDVHTVDGVNGQYGGNNFWYLPRKIFEDGTPIPTEPSPQGVAMPDSLWFGVDTSNHNWVSLADCEAAIRQVQAEGFSWVEAKVSQGSTFNDEFWQTTLQTCQQIGLPVIGYHYVDTSDPAGQAANFVANGGGKNAMLDLEDGSGDITNYWAVVNAFNAAGVNIALSYIPHWYWNNIGQPDLSQVPGLISSNYPITAQGYASTLYAQDGGDAGAGWAPYGGQTPVIWQFTNNADVDGHALCADAFKGSLDQLHQLLGTGGPQMAVTGQQQATRETSTGRGAARVIHHSSVSGSRRR